MAIIAAVVIHKLLKQYRAHTKFCGSNFCLKLSNYIHLWVLIYVGH